MGQDHVCSVDVRGYDDSNDDMGLVSLNGRRATNVRRVRFQLRDAKERRCYSFEGLRSNDSRYVRRYFERVVASASGFAYEERVRARCQIDLIRAERERLEYFCAGPISVGYEFVQA